MASPSDLFLALVVVVDLVLSLWNAYASGVTWGLLRNQPGRTFSKVSAVAGVGLAFAGMAYTTLIVLAYAALWTGFLAVWDFVYLASFDLLVFGAMIVGFGLVVTAQSVTVAYRRRSFGSIAIAAWNVFAEVWDLTIYAQGFRSAANAVRGDRRDRANLTAILAMAIGIALLVTYFAFRRGLDRAESAIAASPRQTAAEGGSAPVEAETHRRHARRSIVAGVVVVAVVVAAIVGFHYLSPSPQVKVQEIDVFAPTGVCGLDAHAVYYAGFTDVPGASEVFSLEVLNFNATPCTVQNVTTNTSGFGLSAIGTPLTVGGNLSAYLNLTIELPPNAFDGALHLVYT